MFEIFPPQAIVSAALLLLALLGAGAFLWLDGRRAVQPSTAARRAVRHATLTTVVATVPVAIGLGLPSLVLVGDLPLPTRLVAVLPLTATLGGLAVYAVGELTWPKPQGATRQATLTARAAGDVAPPVARRLAWAWAGATLLAALAFALLASGPRQVSRVVGWYDAFTLGPFPGWLWTAPILAATGLVLVLCEVVLRLVAARPAVVDVSEEWDMWLRRRVARRTLRTVQLVTGLTLSGLVLLAGLSMRWLGLGNGSGVYAPPPSTVHVVAGNSLLVLGLVLLLAAVATAVWPAHDRAPEAEQVGTVGAAS